jgi:hypothetical protein
MKLMYTGGGRKKQQQSNLLNAGESTATSIICYMDNARRSSRRHKLGKNMERSLDKTYGSMISDALSS